MPSDQLWARFEAAEAAEVVACFDVDAVRTIHEYRRGSRQSPKVLIETSSGQYLLKRRVREKGVQERLAFTVAVHAQCKAAGVPVAVMIPVRGTGDSVLVRGGAIYELFEYVSGKRFARTSEQAMSAGATLASMHGKLKNFDIGGGLDGSYHDSRTVRMAIAKAGAAVAAADPGVDRARLDALIGMLSERYENSCRKCGEAVESWGREFIIHGDFHPGNLLFDGDEVRVVLDFDSVRRGCAQMDVANGAMQFSLAKMVSGTPASTWSHSLDLHRLQAFLRGYAATAANALAGKGEFLSPLMIEASIGETMVPVARTGNFGGIPALEFLEYVERKTAWMLNESSTIASTLEQSCLQEGIRKD
ncbi:MAG: hypothetical protein EXS00_00020 [Phycisphaerales bacterium]|nr:hypothetical protein [Phycisphaerales bacterium]